MPRPPQVSPTTRTLSNRVFSQLVAKGRARAARGEVVLPLHVGDTYREPPEVARVERLKTADHPGLHRYAPVRGEPALLEAIGDRTEALGRRVPTDRIQVMSGATSGLSVVMQTILDPGDEVLLPAPFWPLIRGLIAGRGGVPIQVPLFDRLGDGDIESRLEAAVTPRTVALYVNTPHNPTGCTLREDHVDAMVRVARRHDLWLVTDEAYQDLYYGSRPTPVWTRDDVQDRYIACHTLSKSYGLAGARIGYAHGPPELMELVGGVQTFSTYCAPRPMQFAAAEALRHGGPWLAECRSLYGQAGAKVAETLGVPAPEGGTFLLYDASPHLRPGETDALPFLERCLDEGVMLTPGASCGEDYTKCVRLCFTSVPESVLDDALERLGRALHR